jgi:ATP-dependent Lhr-like helicase
VLAASDPANIWSLPFAPDAGGAPDSFARPRGARSLLVTRSGRVVATSDARARGVSVRPDLDDDAVTAAVRALLQHITQRRARDLLVESINGQPAATSPLANAFIAAGLRLTTGGLRYYASL